MDIFAISLMELSQQNLDDALRLLGNLLAVRKTGEFWLVVCGGSALLAQKIISRATEDVDILAIRDWDGGVDGAYPLPEALKLAASEVAEELRLGKNWPTAWPHCISRISDCCRRRSGRNWKPATTATI